MRRLVPLLFFALLAFSIPAHPAPAISPGASCAKKDDVKKFQGKSYKCVKKSSRLAWELITKKNTTLNSVDLSNVNFDSSKFLSIKPWSEDLNSKSLSDAAQKAFIEWAKSQKGSKNHLYIAQKGTPSNRQEILRKADELGSRLFSSLLSERTLTVVGKDNEWVKNQLNSNGGKYQKCAGSSGNLGLGYCLDNGPSHGYVVNLDVKYDSRNPGSDGGALLAHEYFHLVQWGIAGTYRAPYIKSKDPESTKLFPAWFIEGSADFVGFSVAALSQGSQYWDGYQAMWQYAPAEPQNNRNRIEDYELRTGEDNKTPTYPYTVGRIAIEYLVASVGFQKVIDILREFNKTRDFEKSFESAVGISKNSFYEKFEKVREKLQLPPVSWKLVCSNGTIQNSIISSLSSDMLNQKLDPINCVSTDFDQTVDLSQKACSVLDQEIRNSFGMFKCQLINGRRIWSKNNP